MRTRSILALSPLCVWFAACSDSAGPVITDVDAARAAWLSSSPADYTFEFASASSWFPKSGYFRVVVETSTIAAPATLPA